MKKNRLRAAALAVILALGLFPASAQSASRKVALTATRNLSMDPRADYLGGILQGLLAWDLSRAPGIILVDRASLDRVLAEQELQLSGLAGDPAASARVGQLLGADFLVSIDYVILSGEILVTASSTDVRTGRQSSFVERGSTENLVHRLAEALAEHYSGVRPSFADPASERSILTLRDETPGSIALHSIMRHAEIFLDGEFAGYTTGSSETPFIMDKLTPGEHSVRVHVGHGFGVVLLPQVEFADWTATVTVMPGKRHVLRDETRDFNSVLYRLQVLVNHDQDWKPGAALGPWPIDFVDRGGKRILGKLSLAGSMRGADAEFAAILELDGQRLEWTVLCPPGKEIEDTRTLGLISVEISVDRRWDDIDLGVDLERSDVYQGMYDDE